MSFPKIPRQLQEETIFPIELKRFRYEEVTSLNVIGKRKICDFEKSDIVKFFKIYHIFPGAIIFLITSSYIEPSAAGRSNFQYLFNNSWQKKAFSLRFSVKKKHISYL